MSSLGRTVINEGFCIGCGVCVVYEPERYKIKYNSYGMYQAEDLLDSHRTKKDASIVCPFADNGKSEDIIAKKIFKGLLYNNSIGYYKSLYIGYVQESEYRTNGSSGGMITWILTELMEKDLIDAVIHVKKVNNDKYFIYGISNSVEEIKRNSKSRYYPIEMSKVLNYVKNNNLRFALVGVPCFIKAVRFLAEEDEIYKQRIKFYLGIVCGHLKSAKYAEFLAMQQKINIEQLEEIDFRYKNVGLTAGEYSTLFKVSGEQIISPPTKKMFGTNWGYGFFKYKACDYCDDVFAETADMVSGDAWITPYSKDYRGTNIVIARNEIIYNIIENAIEKNRLSFHRVNEDKIIRTQLGGIRHKQKYLGYRVRIEGKKTEWLPKKRYTKIEKIPILERYKQKIRLKMREKSHIKFLKAQKSNNFDQFKNSIIFYIWIYHILNKDKAYFIPKFIKRFLKKYLIKRN